VKAQLARVLRGERLSEAEAALAMGAIMDGEATPAQIGALLGALAVRGECEDELVGFARCMRERAVPLRGRDAFDTCGTGGDGASTFNISTVASLVLAACGLRVAKHGNRSASGACGSADLLEALGLRLDVDAERTQASLDEVGWAFLFAPGFHAATRHASGPRRELGVRTAFNLLGPLTNPARPRAQLVGVPRPELAALLARCLRRLGSERAWVVHGAGLDELSPCGPTRVAALDEQGVREFELEPEQAGLTRCAPHELRADDLPASVRMAEDVLAGRPGAARTAVVLNAAAALVVAGEVADLRLGAVRAEQVLDSGRAALVLTRAREVSHS
jgi:anthranilate phosphoribosyltransferase